MAEVAGDEDTSVVETTSPPPPATPPPSPAPSSGGNNTTIIAALVAVAVAAAILLVLWLNTRGTLSEAQVNATEAVAAAETQFAALSGEADSLAQSATEVADSLSGLETDATAAAATAVAESEAMATELNDTESSATEAAATAAAELASAEGDNEALAAEATVAAETAEAEIEAMVAAAATLSAAMEAAEATAAAEITSMAAAAATSEAEMEAAAATADAEMEAAATVNAEMEAAAATADAEMEAAATVNAEMEAAAATTDAEMAAMADSAATLEADAAAVAAAATESAGQSRNALIGAESSLLRLQADATAAAELAAANAATAEAMGGEMTEAEAEIAALETEVAVLVAAASITPETIIVTAIPPTATPTPTAVMPSVTEEAPEATEEAPEATAEATEEATAEATEEANSTSASTGDEELDAVLASLGISGDAVTLATSDNTLVVNMANVDDTLISEFVDGTYSNFVITAELTWDTDSTADYCGFSFHRADNDNYYTAEVDREDGVRFFARFQGEWDNLTTNSTDVVDTNAGARNRLTLVVQGTDFTFFANGTQIDKTQDERLTGGELAVLGGTFQGSGETRCIFDDIRVYELSGADDLKDDEAATDTDDTTAEADETSGDLALYNGMVAATTDDGAFVLGDPAAPITVVEFADYRCPFCQDYHPTITAFIEQEVATGRARLEFRMFPTADADAVTFRLMECAVGDNPARFWALQTDMYEIAATATDADDLLSRFSAVAGMAPAELVACVETADAYITDQALGREVGATGTPAVFVRDADGVLSPAIPGQTSGPVPLAALTALVEAAQ